MGNFEKLVVLTVLFLSAIVLAISLNDGKKKGESQSPLEAARVQLEGKRSAGEVHAADSNPASRAGAALAGRKGELLLSTEVTPLAQATPERSSDGRERILRSTRGLTSAGIEDYMVYQAAAGDTWAGLSERFYASGRHVSLLRHANEDMERPLAGETILVPVYDFSAEAGKRAPLTAQARVPDRDAQPLGPSVAPDAGSTSRTSAPQAPAEGLSSADYRNAARYEVRPGDSLSVISQRVYGTGSRWGAIFEANRTLLQSPDWLQVGMQLHIPRGAELEAFAAAASSVAGTTPDTGSNPRKEGGRVR